MRRARSAKRNEAPAAAAYALEGVPARWPAEGLRAALVGECVEGDHPTLQGRARVRWRDEQGDAQERWLPTLAGVTVRAGDRVLLEQPANFPEAVVSGVLDGFARRPDVEPRRSAALRLERDECLRVEDSEGRPLLELRRGEAGPTLRLLREGVDLDVPGRLRMSAEGIELRARAGSVRVQASDDVVVRGEVIHLN